MAINLGTDSEPIIAFVSLDSGMLDAVLRCKDRATFDAVALMVGLRVELTESVTDQDTGETTTQGTGKYRYADDVDVDHIGPIEITPATVDAEGNVITPAVFDTRHHVNFRLGHRAMTVSDANGNPAWVTWAVAWSIAGDLDVHTNAAEVAKVLHGVSLIDADTIKSPSRVWL